MRCAILIVVALAFGFVSLANAQTVIFDKTGDEVGPVPSKLIEVVREPAVCECDLTGDGIVDVSDFMQAYYAWGAIGNVPADVNGDGFVDIEDLIAIVENFGLCADYEAKPQMVEATRGTPMGGNMACVLKSDNHRFRICSIEQDGHFITAARIVCHGPAKTASRIEFTLETGVNRTGVEAMVCLWNFHTESYDLIDQYIPALTDTVRFYSYIPNPSAYVSDTGLIVLRLRTSAPAGGYTHVMRIDHVELMVTP